MKRIRTSIIDDYRAFIERLEPIVREQERRIEAGQMGNPHGLEECDGLFLDALSCFRQTLPENLVLQATSIEDLRSRLEDVSTDDRDRIELTAMLRWGGDAPKDWQIVDHIDTYPIVASDSDRGLLLVQRVDGDGDALWDFRIIAWPAGLERKRAGAPVAENPELLSGTERLEALRRVA